MHRVREERPVGSRPLRPSRDLLIRAELLGAGWESALVAALLTWRCRDLGSSPGDKILDFSLLFFDFGFCREIDFLRGMVE